jgi:hypothetical protein
LIPRVYLAELAAAVASGNTASHDESNADSLLGTGNGRWSAAERGCAQACRSGKLADPVRSAMAQSSFRVFMIGLSLVATGSG